jgi:hypothetical protein
MRQSKANLSGPYVWPHKKPIAGFLRQHLGIASFVREKEGQYFEALSNLLTVE